LFSITTPRSRATIALDRAGQFAQSVAGVVPDRFELKRKPVKCIRVIDAEPKPMKARTIILCARSMSSTPSVGRLELLARERRELEAPRNSAAVAGSRRCGRRSRPRRRDRCRPHRSCAA
jgi:hypothetical protein